MTIADKNTIVCLTQEEYKKVIENTKEVFVFETAVTDADSIREVYDSMPVWQSIWIMPDEIYGIVFIG